MPELIDVLLGDNPEAGRPEAPWTWTRHNATIPCRGLFTDELRNVRKQATATPRDPKTGRVTEVFDSDAFDDYLILACTPNGPWFDQRVRDHYKVVESREALRIAMRNPEDYGALLQHCMALCGLGELQATPEEQAKN